MKQRTPANPLVWGFIGAILMACAVPFLKMTGTLTMASPIAGAFFTGWLAAHLWDWSGRERH